MQFRRKVLETYRSEEEQIEVLKKWWQENGFSIIASIAVALAIVFGWQFWQKSEQSQVDNASIAYQEMLEAIGGLETNSDDIKIATIDHMAENLKANYAGSGYSHFAALFKARQAVEDGELAAAEEELRWVLANKPIAEVELLTSLRLAKVLFAQERGDEAMALVSRSDTGVFAYSYLELKGDMLVHNDDHQGAFDAYTQALAEVTRLKIPEPQTLAVKLGYAKSFL